MLIIYEKIKCERMINEYIIKFFCNGIKNEMEYAENMASQRDGNVKNNIGYIVVLFQ